MSDTLTFPKDADFSSLDDQTLGAVALGFEAEEAWVEVERRANAGIPDFQRFIAYVGLRLWAAGKMPAELLLEQTEPFARAVARTGRDADLELLAGIVSIRAEYHRERGEEAFAQAAEVEALTLIGAVANGTEDAVVAQRAAKDFNEMAKGFSPLSRAQAEAELWVQGVICVEQRQEPEVEVLRMVKG